MKKIFALLTLTALICTSVYASGVTTLYEEDFENTGGLTAVEYMAQSENIEEPKVTNHGLKSIDFSKESGSNALKFTGYTVAEQPNNGSKQVNFVFDNPYTLADYPNTKLVVSFSEYITRADRPSYTHTLIQGGGKNIVQMFWANSVGDAPTYRCNNNGNIGKKAELNKKLESIYIIDLEKKTFDFIFDGSEYNNAAFNNEGIAVTQIDKLCFNIDREHTFSVDDIKVYVMPKDAPLELTEPSLNGDENVNVESSFTAKLSSYISNTDAITVTANGETIDKDKYSISQKYVNEDGGYVLLTIDFNENLNYLTEYKITFGAEIKNIIGTTLGEIKEFTFTTEKEAKAYIDKIECFSGFMSGGENMLTLYEAKNKYVTFNVEVSNDFTSQKKGVIFIECRDENGKTIDKGFVNVKFTPGNAEYMTYSTYISDDVYSVNAYVCDSVAGGKPMSDVIAFAEQNQ